MTVLLRALGYGTNAQIKDLIGEDPRISVTLDKDSTVSEEEGLLEIYKRLRPGAANSRECQAAYQFAVFEPKRYDLARVGRYKLNKKLALSARLYGRISANDIVSPVTGEILVEAGERISRAAAEEIQNAGINQVEIVLEDQRIVKLVGNNFVDAKYYLDFDPREAGINERVHYPVFKEILDRELKGEELKEALRENLDALIPKHVIKDDIVASINYLVHLFNDIGHIDDIDHLGNRRLRAVGELLQNQFRIGLSRMERVVKERMTIQDVDVVITPGLINIRPVVALLKNSLEAASYPSLWIQTNPLAD